MTRVKPHRDEGHVACASIPAGKVPRFRTANVTFSAIEVRSSQGEWVPVSGTFPMTKVDLSLKLLEGMECRFEPEIDVESVEHEH